jgi:hypothetical protein
MAPNRHSMCNCKNFKLLGTTVLIEYTTMYNLYEFNAAFSAPGGNAE